MTDIINRLRTCAAPFADEIAAHIEELEQRVRDQHATMDKAASIMLEAIVSEDGIDAELADACIDRIRGMFAEVGKTTVEHYQGLIYAKVAELAGIPPHDEFDIMAELDKPRPGPPSPDTVRLDALTEAAGFMRGTSVGAVAFRVLGHDSWHPDLRAAIDDSVRAKAADAKQDA
ncbi:hypothetical protein [Massilia sp. TSP1-1-2]|uniref:hypothetical protein n=1 Tax=Massilia sp. TSP1-1-2 TaxID=2804649 RepID=UPI003CE895DC